ncbi:hypothetical protein BKA70DRAFT_1135851 [Coprinopsis sp. MPI-PUGE-AT-0042]|nr:hypothetical protein BKA70DRAFT_1135851 [Coprinopsis sp. MPI-PUGE-AT-0042]
MANNYRSYAAKEPLSSRSEVHRLDAGLTGVAGAQDVIKLISSKRNVTKLLLGHNELGDDGCTVLFKFLGSQIGRRYSVTEISLNSNKIGNQGLLAVCQYMSGNRALKELFIQANSFTGDPHIISTFVKSLNASCVEVLAITTNHGLGDAFADTFFPALNCASLRELHMSSIGLTPRSVPLITGFIRSPERCRLSMLKCNGNSLGWKGLKSIARAIEQKNYSLTVLEFHANQLTGSDLAEYETEEEDLDDLDSPELTQAEAMTASILTFNRLVIRNATMKREAEYQALQLLRYARTLLLHKSLDVQSETSPPTNESRNFRFTDLPIELQLEVLSRMALHLSPSQRSRILHYAADPTTLPPLLPRLVGKSDGCLPDPGVMGIGTGKVWALDGGQSHQCGAGQCMGARNTVSCSIETSRSQWLRDMGCDMYDPQ